MGSPWVVSDTPTPPAAVPSQWTVSDSATPPSAAPVPTTGPLEMPMRQAQAIQAQNAPVDAVGNATALNHFLPNAGMAAGGLAGSLLGPVGSVGGSALGGALGKATAQHMQGLDDNALPQLKQQGIEAAKDGALGLAGELLVPAIGGLWSKIPTRAKAGALFDEVMAAAKDQPVNLTRTAPALDRVAQLTDAGGPTLNAPNKLMLRSQTVNPIPYQEARDFYSNISNLSAADKLAANGPMKAAVGKLAAAFKQDIGDTAAAVGKGQQYEDAMTMYRQAVRNREMAQRLAKYGAGAALGGTALYPALEKLRQLFQ